ncbi:hypothetical protein FQN51_007874 [Onygenales sp. PD_10]|nr:hypothetical protein FQN51_007874 [Onygenales sp. PD_10]
MAESTFSRLSQLILQSVGYHHILIFILLVPVTFSSILVAGCSNSSLANVYLLSLSYAANISSSPLQNAHPAQLNPNLAGTFANLTEGIGGNVPSFEIRTGYFGHCINQNSGLWVCARNVEQLTAAINNQKTSDIDPLNLLYISKVFKDQMVFSGLIFPSIPFAFICSLLLGTFPGWHEEIDEDGNEREVKPFPSKPISQLATILAGIGSVLTLVSAFWQHISSSGGVTMSEGLYYGAVKGHIGTVAMVLGWGSFLAAAIVCLGLIIMILSISLLDRLTDE